MEEIPAGNPSRTIQGFAPDKKFQVNRYWKARDKERLLREACYTELLRAEVVAAERRKAEENAQAEEKAKEEAAVREKEKEKEKDKDLEKATQEKEKTVEPAKEKEAGPSGNAKGKAREVPRTPRKVTPKKSQTEIRSESEGEEEEEKPQCIQCVKRNIPCIPQAGKKVCIACGKRKMRCEFFDKTTWAVMDGTKQVVEAMRELAGLGRRREAGRLEVIWHEHQRFVMEIETRATADLGAVDATMLQLLELKSKGVEIPVDLETRIRTEREVIQRTLKEQLEDLTARMDNIQKCTAWTKNGLLKLTPEVPPAAVQGTKRKGDNEGDRAEGSKKKKKKRVAEAEDEESTLR
ncbi:hypothetical protein M422DRAFT_253567 [Sphaerobolus stellatus SS14]|uniref:Unplaced genomic scaffold SPHSTscaffold_50, whole genome shotgun sequence n=1 Tax=Sphaerobolus stellatus (strain SS14) TaxID=990650 RepID=A0A0C9VXD8_SPHS4|nr:hypothetical protein M422DRAFT_253567 [Sphaerobolus stellatus SS14]